MLGTLVWSFDKLQLKRVRINEVYCKISSAVWEKLHFMCTDHHCSQHTGTNASCFSCEVICFSQLPILCIFTLVHSIFCTLENSKQDPVMLPHPIAICPL